MKYIILLIFFSLAVESRSQTPFNKRVNYGFEVLVFSGIVAKDSCYFITGIAVDSIFPYKYGSIFAKFDLSGNLKSIKTYWDFTEGTFETWQPVFTLLQDNVFDVSHMVLSPFEALAVFVGYNLKGDTILFQKYCSAGGDTSWTTGRDFIQYDNQTYFLLITDLISSENNYNFSIIKTDQNGNKIWHKIPFFHPATMAVMPSSIIKDDDGTILVLAYYSNEYISTKHFKCRDLLVRLDTSGTVLNSWLSPENRLQGSILSDLIKTRDGGYAFTTGLGVELGDSLAPYHDMSFNGGICKLNRNFEEEWFVTSGDPEIGGHLTYLRNIVELDDGSFVSAGTYLEPLEDSIYIEGYDIPDFYNINGWLAKVSATGDILWSRQFHFVESPRDEHNIYDVKVTPDGGFMMCGEAIDLFFLNPPGQQGWLIKTDEYGCLVPGCQTEIQEVLTNFPLIQIYPNPASNYLYIYLSNKNDKIAAKGRLINLSGYVIDEFNMWQNDLTYILPLNNYPAGVYIFQYLQEDNVRFNKTIIISH